MVTLNQLVIQREEKYRCWKNAAVKDKWTEGNNYKRSEGHYTEGHIYRRTTYIRTGGPKASRTYIQGTEGPIYRSRKNDLLT